MSSFERDDVLLTLVIAIKKRNKLKYCEFQGSKLPKLSRLVYVVEVILVYML